MTAWAKPDPPYKGATPDEIALWDAGCDEGWADLWAARPMRPLDERPGGAGAWSRGYTRGYLAAARHRSRRGAVP